MKQVININFQGRIVSIEVTAFEKVKAYIESLKKHFAHEEGRDEIINDIEGRVGELFDVKIKKGASCITDADVDSVIESIGRPEQLDAGDADGVGTNSSEQSTNNEFTRPKKLFRNESEKILGGVCSGLAAYLNIDVVIVRVLFLLFFGPLLLPYIILWIVVPGSAGRVLPSPQRKLFRDTDEKVIAGVCSGLGKYLGINAWIPRIIFLLPLLGFIFNWNNGLFDFPGIFSLTLSPGSLFIYLILWFAIPRARTSAEKLQMRGEKVDINSIRNSVLKESKSFEQKEAVSKKDLSGINKEHPEGIKTPASDSTPKASRSFLSILGNIIKLAVYFILGSVLLIVLVVYFIFATFLLISFPARELFLTSPWQEILVHACLILLVVLPVIAFIIWIIRRIIRARRYSRVLRIGFASLWLAGVLMAGLLLESISGNFSHHQKTAFREIQLSHPTAGNLYFTHPATKEKNNLSFKEAYGSFLIIGLDTLPSKDDSFRVFMRTSAFGPNNKSALNNANAAFSAVQVRDSVILISQRLNNLQQQKIHGQLLEIKVYVPAGKKLHADKTYFIYNKSKKDSEQREKMIKQIINFFDPESARYISFGDSTDLYNPQE